MVQIRPEIPQENRKKMLSIVLSFDMLTRVFFCLGDYGLSHSSRWLLIAG
jgi:hypothetical protein